MQLHELIEKLLFIQLEHGGEHEVSFRVSEDENGGEFEECISSVDFYEKCGIILEGDES